MRVQFAIHTAAVIALCATIAAHAYEDPPVACQPQTVNWGEGNACGAYVDEIAAEGSLAVVSERGTSQGSATVTCSLHGQISVDGDCLVGCPGQLLSWGGGLCESNAHSLAHGADAFFDHQHTISQTEPLRRGRVRAACQDGEITLSDEICEESPPTVITPIAPTAPTETNAAAGSQFTYESMDFQCIQEEGRTTGACSFNPEPGTADANINDSAGFSAPQTDPTSVCGDGVCDIGEEASCPFDCGQSGNCGPANGMSLSEFPNQEQGCLVGTLAPSDTQGADGSYDWFCLGSGVGGNAQCSATRQVTP